MKKHQLIQRKDYEKLAKRDFRLVKDITIPCPHPVPRKLQVDKTITWRAEQDNDLTEEPLHCHLRCSKKNGWELRLPARYHWDGSSAPAVVKDILRVARTNKRTIRAFLHHDAIYEGMRAKVIPHRWSDERRSCARKWADRSMRRILKADDYSKWKRWATYRGVRIYSSDASKPQ